MTQLMGRPILGLPSDLGTRSALADVLMGVRTALLTLALVAVPVLGLWVLAPYSDDTAAGAVRLAGSLWLLGHAAPLVRGDEAGPVTVTPLLLTALTLVVVHRAGARIGRRGRPNWRAPLALAAGYLGVAAAVVAQCADPEAVLRSRPVADLAAVAVVLAGGLGHGLWTGAGGSLPPLPAATARRLAALRPPVPGGPPGAAAAVRRAVAAWLLALVAAGGLLLTAAVVPGGAGRSVHVLGGGAAGFLGLLLACAALMPNAVLWAASYALGTGFAVGTGTAVAPAGTTVGPLPEFPLLALVPASGGAGWGLPALALPVLAAVWPALLLGRSAAGGQPARGRAGEDGGPWSVRDTVLAALAAAVLGGGSAAAAAWVAGGGLAPGRMSELGPAAWQAGLASAAWLAATALPGALLVRRWHTRNGVSGWWPALDRFAVRRTVRLRAALHRVLTRVSDLRLPFSGHS
ncbi:DUF6350 family protein [Kitasatospora sp. NBC_00374]|uniref:cell division protein PerM n=1 Tax=Kitasatospora sp. NBC_00374 TaxID=2975964 RepID=UPI00324E6860